MKWSVWDEHQSDPDRNVSQDDRSIVCNKNLTVRDIFMMGVGSIDLAMVCLLADREGIPEM